MVIGMMATPALAVDININGKGQSYSAYRVLDLTTSLKGDCEHEADAHTSTCYNYNYTVNPVYRDALKAACGLELPEGTSEAEIDRAIVGWLSSKNTESDADTLRDMADALYKAIHSAGTAADATGTRAEGAVKTTISVDKQGYYLLTETSKGTDPDMVSLVMLDTAGHDDVTVTAKEGVPTLTKKILDESGAAVEGTTVAFGDKVTYELTVTVPKEFADYEGLMLKVHDKLPAGVTLDAEHVDFVATHEGALKEGQTLPEWALDVAGAPDITMTLNLADASQAFAGGVQTFTLKFNATVSAETAVLGETGNTNTAYLEFSANPYADAETDTSRTLDDTAIFYTFGLKVNKVDEDAKALPGADFKLQKKNAEGAYVDLMESGAEDGATEFNFRGLDEGEYRLVETVTPDGFAAIDPIDFELAPVVDEDGKLTALDVKLNDKSLTEGEDASFTVVLSDGIASTSVINVAGNRMPITGGAGVYALYIGGAALVFMGGAAVIMKKKKSADAE